MLPFRYYLEALRDYIRRIQGGIDPYPSGSAKVA
jgi:hypothetical protein